MGLGRRSYWVLGGSGSKGIIGKWYARTSPDPPTQRATDEAYQCISKGGNDNTKTKPAPRPHRQEPAVPAGPGRAARLVGRGGGCGDGAERTDRNDEEEN